MEILGFIVLTTLLLFGLGAFIYAVIPIIREMVNDSSLDVVVGILLGFALLMLLILMLIQQLYFLFFFNL